MRHRPALTTLAPFALLAGAFAFLHSGARAAALCERERFVHSGELSLWPPGARCSYGEPEIQDILINPWFGMAIIAVALLLLVGMMTRVRE